MRKGTIKKYAEHIARLKRTGRGSQPSYKEGYEATPSEGSGSVMSSTERQCAIPDLSQ